MNQAVLRSKADNGDVSGWFEDIYGNSTSQREKRNEFFMQYIGKYLNIVKTEEYGMWTIYYLPEGGSFSLTSPLSNGRDWMFSPGDLKLCLQQNQNICKNIMGSCAFAFIFSSAGNGHFRAYDYAWTGTEDSLKNSTSLGCYSSSGWPAYCTRLIQYNGWKIPDDYPYRLKIY